MFEKTSEREPVVRQPERRGRHKHDALAGADNFDNPFRIDSGSLMKANVDSVYCSFDSRHAPGPTKHSKSRVFQKIADRKRQRSKAVFHLAIQAVNLVLGPRGRDLLVDAQTLQFVIDKVGRVFSGPFSG